MRQLTSSCSLLGVPQRRLGKAAGHWCWRMLVFSFFVGGCGRMFSFMFFFLSKGLPGCLQFYHDTCSKPGEKLNQEIIDRLQTENTHLKSWAWVERDFCDLWWFSRFQRGDICDFWTEKSWITSLQFGKRLCFPRSHIVALSPQVGGAENCWRPPKPESWESKGTLRFPWHKTWGNLGLLIQLEIQDQRGFWFPFDLCKS